MTAIPTALTDAQIDYLNGKGIGNPFALFARTLKLGDRLALLEALLSADGEALSVYVGDDKLLSFGADSDITMEHSGADVLVSNGAGSGRFKVAADTFRVVDPTDTTKRIAWDGSGIATATTRTITMPDRDVDLGYVMDDQIVTATLAVADSAAGVNTVALTMQLKRRDHSTNIASARQVLIVAGASQYAPEQTPEASVTFSAATVGSIVASGNGWALVETSATGAFACTATNTDDETRYFWAETAFRTQDMTKRCSVLASNSDAAAWSS